MPRQKALNQENLRAHNIGVVLSAILRSTTAVSRADIARATGMTKAAISFIVADLIAHGVLHEGKPQQLTTTGKPSNPLEFADGQWLGLGVQIHTDGYGFLIQDFNGNIVEQQWITNTEKLGDVDSVLEEIDQLISPVVENLRAQGKHVLGGGLAVPGMVTNSGLLISAPNLGWTHVDFSEKTLVSKYQLTALNEANLAAIAQIPGYAVSAAQFLGRGEEAEETDEISEPASDISQLSSESSFIYISTDVGIGGAYADKGALIAGDNGIAGEIGHISVDMNGPLCRCGRYGCMEMFAGRRAILESLGDSGQQLMDADRSFEFIEQKLNSDNEDERKAAHNSIRTATRAMASAIVSTMNVVDITNVVIGGFWTRFGREWLKDIQQDVIEQLNSVHKESARITFPLMGSYAALHGASEYGLRHLIDNVADYLQNN